MNDYRRRRLRSLLEVLEPALETLKVVRDDEEMSYDALPYSLQCSERGESIMDNCEELNDAVSSLDDVIGSIKNTIN